MSDITIACPKCKHVIKVTEALAGPMVAQQVAAQIAGIKVKENRLAQEAAQSLLDAAHKERDSAESRARALEAKEREQESTLEQKIAERLAVERTLIKGSLQREIGAKLTERETLISGLQTQIEVLKQKAEQGSQQLQGEAQEIQLETMLGKQFPSDNIVPVAKGVYGGDITQSVFGPGGKAAGTILWESKKTRTWSDGWLVKLRDDQRAAKADVSIIVTAALPKGAPALSLIDGVWVCSMEFALAAATLLRHTLIEVASSRQTLDGFESKAELLFEYVSSSKFRLRVRAVVDSMASMKSDLDSERRAIAKSWAKRESQIERTSLGMLNIVGEMQAVAGDSIKEIEGLALPK